MYYAVAVGRRVGIFDSWDECKEQVNGYSGAVYKKFNNIIEANEYIKQNAQPDREVKRSFLPGFGPDKDDDFLDNFMEDDFDLDIDDDEDISGEAMEDYLSLNDNELIAYVDGSYSDNFNNFTYGVVLINNKGEVIEMSGKGLGEDDAELKSMRNVAGELRGAERAVFTALRLGYETIYLHHDYSGISKWVSGEWKAKKSGTQDYKKRMTGYQNHIDIHFIKVKGHDGVKYNEIADKLAAQAYNYHED